MCSDDRAKVTDDRFRIWIFTQKFISKFLSGLLAIRMNKCDFKWLSFCCIFFKHSHNTLCCLFSSTDFFKRDNDFINKMQERFYLRSEEHTSELQSRGHLVCRLLLEKKKKQQCSI